MAKQKRPVSKQPLPNAFTAEGKQLVQDWLDQPKGRAVIRGTDPRNQADSGAPGSLQPDVTNVGFDRTTGDPIFKPAPQLGTPEMNPVPVRQLPVDTSGDLQDTQPFTDAQIQMLLENIYGKKGQGIENYTDGGKRTGPKINVPGALVPSGSLINRPGAAMPTGPLVNIPGAAMPGGPMIHVPGAAMPTGPLVTAPRIDKAKLLAAMARSQAKANGHHLIA